MKLPKIHVVVLSVILSALISCNAKESVKEYTVLEFESHLVDSAIQLLDVRTAAEYGEEHIPGAINIDINEDGFIEKAIETLDQSRPVAIYCQIGGNSKTAGKMLLKKKYHNISNLSGGYRAWRRAHKPVVSAAADSLLRH